MRKIIPVVAVCALTCTSPAHADLSSDLMQFDMFVMLNDIKDKLDDMEMRRDLDDIARMRAETEAYRAAAEALRRQRAPSMYGLGDPSTRRDLEVYRFGGPKSSPSAPVEPTQPHRK